MIRKTYAASTLTLAVLMAAGSVSAQRLEIDYQNLPLSFSSSGLLTVDHDAGSFATAFLKNNAGTIVLDRADIFNGALSAAVFELMYSGTVANPAGLNNISITSGEFKATDIDDTLAAPSIHSTFVNANITGDLDGVSFGSGVLRIEGRIGTFGANPSILVDPAAGDWVYKGEDDSIVGVGSDGVADQLTISDLIRDNYDSGILAVLEVNINTFRDGTLTAGLDADGLFAEALLHGGFNSPDAQIQLTVIPAPGAALLGLVGFGLLSKLRRRFA